MNDKTEGLSIVLDERGDQLHVERPAGESYCNFTLLDAQGRVQCYMSGYAAPIELVVGRPGAAPYLRIGNASVPLDVEAEMMRKLAKFLQVSSQKKNGKP